MAWLIDIWMWLADCGGTAVWQGTSMSILVLAGYGSARLIGGGWGPRIVPAAAAIALVSTQGYYGVELCRNAPAGLLTLTGSFLLFAIGTAIAWTKPRWHRAITPVKRTPFS
jgi:hypothetical protein